MELSTGIQELLVTMLCFDNTPRGAKFVRALVPAKVFDPFYRDVADAAIRYVEQYNEPPGEHTLDIIEALKEKKKDKAEHFDRLYRALESSRENINREYVLSQATNFIRYQKAKTTAAEVLDCLEKDDVDGAEAKMAANAKVTFNLFDPGISLRDPKQALQFLDRKDDEFFETGVKELDAFDLGPVRKGLHLFVGLPNRGKTWWLINLAKHSRMRRRRVLHVTLEMSKERMAQRYMQAFYSVSKRNEMVTRQRFKRDEDGLFIGSRDVVIKDRPHFEDPGIRAHLTRKIEKTVRMPELIIQEFPTGSLTVRDLTAYLDNLEAARQFIPDLLVLDYADLMKIDSKNHRIDLGTIYKELRGIAMERNIAVATATQSNREGFSTKVVTERNTSEDISKIHTADTVITYNQTEEEHELGLARLFVPKARDDKNRMTVLISQAYALGQFCLDSVKMNNQRYWDFIEATEEDEEDEE